MLDLYTFILVATNNGLNFELPFATASHSGFLGKQWENENKKSLVLLEKSKLVMLCCSSGVSKYNFPSSFMIYGSSVVSQKCTITWQFLTKYLESLLVNCVRQFHDHICNNTHPYVFSSHVKYEDFCQCTCLGLYPAGITHFAFHLCITLCRGKTHRSKPGEPKFPKK